MRRVSVYLGVLALLLTCAGSAWADSISGTLTVANTDLASQGAGPYAMYTITGSGGGNGTTTFTTFTVTVSGIDGFVLGDGGVFALNLSAADGTPSVPTTTAITCENGSGASCTALSGPSTANEDGFGTFNYKLQDGNGFSNYDTGFTFTFTTSNAVSAANLLAPNANGADVGAHMAPVGNTACTGFAANTGATNGGSSLDAACGVPEPSALAETGSGLSGIGFVALFRRRRLADNLS